MNTEDTPAVLREPITDGEVTYSLVRAWPRSEGHLLLELADEDGSRVAGQWFADPGRLDEAAAATPAPARVMGPVLLQPDGADARLAALPQVLARPDARLVAHRPGRRAVVHLAGEDPHFVKVVRTSAGPGLAERGQLVGRLIGDSVLVPRLRQDSDPGRGLLGWTTVPGRTLHDLAASGNWTEDAALTAWTQAGQAVSHLHDARTRLPQDTEQGRWTTQDELQAIDNWCTPAVRYGLLDQALVRSARARVEDLLVATTVEPVLGLLHRDLHDKQVLWADGRVGMIDVDTLTVGERALDLANVLVHLELRRAQGLLGDDLARAAAAGFRAGVATRTGPDLDVEAMWSRVGAWALATRLRLAGVYAFRPRWRGVARAFVEQAAGLPGGERLAPGGVGG